MAQTATASSSNGTNGTIVASTTTAPAAAAAAALARVDISYVFTVDRNCTFDFEDYVKQELNFCLDLDKKDGVDICKFFLKGNCAKGAACPFKHQRNDRTVVCKHWLRGLCKKGDQCEFLHEYNLKKMPECWFYSKYGECANSECMYLHVDPESKIKECAWYARGFCKHGAKCRHKHVKKAICQNFITGFCPKGPDCPFGHPKYELPPMNDHREDGPFQGGGGGSGGGGGGGGGGGYRNFKDVVCFKCNELGHFANNCPKRRRFQDGGGPQQFGRQIPTVSS